MNSFVHNSSDSPGESWDFEFTDDGADHNPDFDPSFSNTMFAPGADTMDYANAADVGLGLTNALDTQMPSRRQKSHLDEISPQTQNDAESSKSYIDSALFAQLPKKSLKGVRQDSPAPNPGNNKKPMLAKRTDYDINSHKDGAHYKGARKPPTNGLHPGGKCLTCIAYERVCRPAEDGHIKGDSCATCLGGAAKPGKKNMVRSCVWWDPENGLNCYADAPAEMLQKLKAPKKKAAPREAIATPDHTEWLQGAPSTSCDQTEHLPLTAPSTNAETDLVFTPSLAQLSLPTPESSPTFDASDFANDTTTAEALCEISDAHRSTLMITAVILLSQGVINDDAANNAQVLHDQLTQDAIDAMELSTEAEMSEYCTYISILEKIIDSGNGVGKDYFEWWAFEISGDMQI